MENRTLSPSAYNRRESELRFKTQTLQKSVFQKDGQISNLKEQIKGLKAEIQALKDKYEPVINSVNEFDFRVKRAIHAIKTFQDSRMSEEWLQTKSRKREIVICRQVFMYLMKNKDTTLRNIGNYCGGKDHSTVIAALNTVGDLMDTDRKFRETMKKIIELFNR